LWAPESAHIRVRPRPILQLLQYVARDLGDAAPGIETDCRIPKLAGKMLDFSAEMCYHICTESREVNGNSLRHHLEAKKLVSGEKRNLRNRKPMEMEKRKRFQESR